MTDEENEAIDAISQAVYELRALAAKHVELVNSKGGCVQAIYVAVLQFEQIGLPSSSILDSVEMTVELKHTTVTIKR